MFHIYFTSMAILIKLLRPYLKHTDNAVLCNEKKNQQKPRLTLCPVMTLVQLPLSMSHNLTLLSLEPVAT